MLGVLAGLAGAELDESDDDPPSDVEPDDSDVDELAFSPELLDAPEEGAEDELDDERLSFL
ncbi:hypothetical protein BH10ACT3_BH10ACT3_19000 [soil metagenome]